MRSIRSLFLLLLFFFLGCKSSQNSTLHSGNVAYVSNEGLETLTLRSTDYGTNKEDAIENAKRLAFQNLFFRGVPNSPYRDPILGISETEKYREHEDYLKEFYDNRMYTFINRSSELISDKKRPIQATVSLTINMRALKKDLQENNMMPKFGL
ncbi:MAG: hypothetical protein WBV11_13460 [Salegentibacter sp.]